MMKNKINNVEDFSARDDDCVVDESPVYGSSVIHAIATSILPLP